MGRERDRERERKKSERERVRKELERERGLTSQIQESRPDWRGGELVLWKIEA